MELRFTEVMYGEGGCPTPGHRGTVKTYVVKNLRAGDSRTREQNFEMDKMKEVKETARRNLWQKVA